MVLTDWLETAINALARLFPPDLLLSSPGNLRGLIAVILVCIVCGAVGSLVVGNRMAFFSDALAHCAFAGVALGLLTGLLAGVPVQVKNGAVSQIHPFYNWGVILIMVVFGVLVGVAIVYVREKTTLASDTVIGVFFAGAIGFGAMLLSALGNRSRLKPDQFLFGNPFWVDNEDIVTLMVLLLVAAILLFWTYNRLVFSSFNSSLARSRRFPIRLFSYVFIILLALIVNLSLKTVGALLINSMLIVPAATASNLSRNLRQMFWLSLGLSLFAGITGVWTASSVHLPDPGGGPPIYFGWGGTIIVISMLLFFASMAIGPRLRGARTE
jgi:zinc transport system permease protein